MSATLRTAMLAVGLLAPSVSFAQDPFIPDPVIEAVLELIDSVSVDIEPFEPAVGVLITDRCTEVLTANPGLFNVDPDVEPAIICELKVDSLYNRESSVLFDGKGPWGLGSCDETLVNAAVDMLNNEGFPLTSAMVDQFVNDHAL